MNGFNTFLEIISALGILFFAIGQFRAGRDTAKSNELNDAKNTVQLYQSKMDLLEKEMKEMKAQQKHDGEEIIRLQEQIKHKDDQIKQYVAILQNRDPELQKVLTSINVTLEDTNHTLEDIKDYISKK